MKPTGPMDDVVEQLRRTALLRDSAALADGELLESYVRARDESAFEALVWRHGPMVWGVCRRVLGNEADAEDAFQATFLVLARKADSVAPRSRVGNWLYGVAHNTARKARATDRSRRAREQSAREVRPPESPREEPEPLHALLDEELGRLPEKYRAPVVLCDLQGRTVKEAAHHLGWPQGTVAGRLARARGLLAQRLTRRGLALSAAALAASLAQGTASAVPRLLVSPTVKAALAFAAGPVAAGVVSAQVIALTEGVTRAMMLNKLKPAALAAAVVILAGALGVALSAVSDRQTPRPAVKDGEKPQAAAAWKQRHEVKVKRGTQIFSASISPDGKVVAYATGGGVRLYDAVKGKELALVDLDFAFTTAISPDGKTLATGHIKSIKLWDAVTGKEVATLADDTKNISRVAFSPDGKLLATAEVRTVRLWDLATNKEVRQFKAGKADKRIVTGVAFSPDGKTLATAEGPAGTVKLWEVATGKQLKTLEGHTKWVTDVAFSADGKTLASGVATGACGCGTWPMARSGQRWSGRPAAGIRWPSRRTASWPPRGATVRA